MNTITITKKEYKKLKEAKERLAWILAPAAASEGKREILERAFGILRGGFGKRPSVFYVSKLRRAWRK